MVGSDDGKDTKEGKSLKEEVENILKEDIDNTTPVEKIDSELVKGEESEKKSTEVDEKPSYDEAIMPEASETNTDETELVEEESPINNQVDNASESKSDIIALEVKAADDGTDVTVPEDEPDSKKEDAVVASKPEETAVITAYDTGHSEPKTPLLGNISNDSIEVLHSIGDIHGWAPGLITYLINNKLAEIEINGFPLQDKSGKLNEENMDELFPNPVDWFRKRKTSPAAGLCGQPGFDELGVNDEGHKAIKARWIAESNVGLVQIGDVFDRADHSEIAAEILRQLMIDAPGRVFVLVGNHEQFMLEDDYENWYFNESRNAFTDKEGRPNQNSRNHFRFLPDWTNTATERAVATFDRYVNSTWTLFLTQGAIMEKLGWINPEIDLKPMLGEGWSGYEHAAKLRDEFGRTWSKVIPGALTALVIADTLFHHAEPSAHRTEHGEGLDIPLHKTMRAVDSESNNILFRQYTHGEGSIKNSPDAPLLWSRGSSSGASTGNPAAEVHLGGLAEAWQGLRRIVHGHTPTPGSGHFDAVTGGKSTTVSYLSENPNRQNSKGRANKIRVYNIDEGMSPPYYIGDEPIYSANRMPTGLRIEADEFSSMEASSSTDELVNLNPKHRIDVDSRNLWKWSANEWRISAKPSWGTNDEKLMYQVVEHGPWRGYVSTKKSDESTRTLWDRNAGTTQVSRLMIQKAMSHFFSQNQVKVQEPRPVVLERIAPIGKPLSENKVKEAWNKINVFLFLVKPDPSGGYSVICINSTNLSEEINITNLFSNKLSKSKKLTCQPKTITKIKINNCEKIFLSSDVNSINDAVQEWISGKDSIKSKSSPVIAYFSGAKKPKKKVEITNSRLINLVFVPSKVDSKKNKTVSSRSYLGSSRGQKQSLSSQGKDFKQSNHQSSQQPTLAGQSSNNKASSLPPTPPRNQSQQEQRASNLNPETIKSQATGNQNHQNVKHFNPKDSKITTQGSGKQNQKDPPTSGNKPTSLGQQSSERNLSLNSESKEVKAEAESKGKSSLGYNTDSVRKKNIDVPKDTKEKPKKAREQSLKSTETIRYRSTATSEKPNKFDIKYNGKLVTFPSEFVGVLHKIEPAARIELRFLDDGLVEVQLKNDSNFILIKFRSKYKNDSFGKFKKQDYKLKVSREIKKKFWSSIREDKELLEIIKKYI